MMKVNEFITNGQSHNDDRFLAEVIEKFNEVILFASDGDLHLNIDRKHRKVHILSRICQVISEVELKELTPVETVCKISLMVEKSLCYENL